MQAQCERVSPEAAPPEFRNGLALHAADRLTEAVAAWRHAIRLQPDHADCAVTLGVALLDAGRPGEAVTLLATACEHHPDDPRLLTLHGRALLALGRPGPAAGAFFMALALKPGSPGAHACLAEALFIAGDMDQALDHGAAAFQLAPTAQHAATLSGVLYAHAWFAEALAMAEHALALSPGHPVALLNRAVTLEALGRLPESLAAAEDAIAVAPNSALARQNLALIRLRRGDFTPETWDLHEWRLLVKGKPAWLSAGRAWQGEDLAGRTITLGAEQGLGDTLQFVRYAPLVAARGGRVTLAVPPPLVRLLRGTPGVDVVVPLASDLPPADFVCPLLSLPRIFGTTLDSIPPPLSYAERFAPSNSALGLHVGLVWAGSPGLFHDRQRSIALAELAALAGIPGLQLYSLQWPARPLPPEFGVVDLMQGVQNFADTAAKVAGLDVVVSVDTAVAHLAATMGKPVWLLSRYLGCWRWMHHRADSPWYPSLRIVRQARPNDWQGAIAQVRAELTAVAAAA